MYLLHILLYICHRATTLSLKHMNETECRFKTEVDFVSLIFLFFFIFGKKSLLFPSKVVLYRNVKVSVLFPDGQMCEGCVCRLWSYVFQRDERNMTLSSHLFTHNLVTILFHGNSRHTHGIPLT